MHSPRVSSNFAEGRYWDHWMLVHLASGIAGGFSNVFFGLTNPQVYGLAFAMMLLWEVGELALRIRESLSNRIVDVAVGMVGVWLALRLAPALSVPQRRLAFAVMFAVGLVGMGFGVRAYRRRSTIQAN